ncbi:fatty acyl-CoA reductase wat isoform X2 [Tribolium castaneum]|uniref:Fatty acyl-CoA reductase n=2 Tax=Tribolium castaneum TaxID=7070 RepID=D2A5A7_TRICA|nr:PREDICTED: putative fatty acyl-CoA reductase CG5065 [Tribolium castaneum]XP_973790.1 PREDICTED: putative fatty acyl-CoA reductase CG5065 [Tribolium castaneum]EFA05103.1 Putative fatty acyl-CoA reductase CG5065-like Protein [Tribolium castaneum]|eukprot:XP_008194651.1 PREDICTED: putative fatty acyl-CoA reductase CG5065 [Tribolium castaneum]
MGDSQICKFYDGQNVLVTGGTGFMGKILIEKLLRSTDVATIFLLIREKKGKNVHTRLDDIFDNIIFERLKKERPKFRHRVVAVAGDCSISGLGLTITDRQKLMSEVHIAFHVAATVRFDENLKLSYSINVKGTADVIELCRQMKNLKSLIHVSTAYSNCHLDSIDETFYDYPVDYEKVGALLEKVSKSEADKLTPRVIGKWPNTYTFTKALAEALIRNTATSLPVGIFRPAIVISTYKEPMESWIDNLYGPTGAVAGAASGLLRVFPCNEDVVADIVPVDTCVAGIIAAAWDVTNKRNERTSPSIPIYNYVSSVSNSVTWNEYITLNKIHGTKYPLLKALWTIKIAAISDPRLYLLMRIFLHLIPAFFLDFCAIIVGQKPRLVSMYSKIHKFSDVIAFFCTREWKFTNDNVENLWEKMNTADKELFPLSITTVPWITYFRGYFKGIRVHLLNDPMSTLDEARARKRKFDFAHNGLKFLFVFIIVTLFWIVVFKTAALFSSDTEAVTFSNSTDNFLTDVLNS